MSVVTSETTNSPRSSRTSAINPELIPTQRHSTKMSKTTSPPKQYFLLPESLPFRPFSLKQNLERLSQEETPTMTAKPGFKSIWTQFFPPKAQFTDKDIPDDLSGK